MRIVKALRPIKRVVVAKDSKKRTKHKAKIVVPRPEHGRRTLAKQETTPVALSTLNVRRLLNDGIVEKKKEKWVLNLYEILWTMSLSFVYNDLYVVHRDIRIFSKI